MQTISVTPLWDTFIPYISAIFAAFCAALTVLANSWLAAHKASLAQDDVDQALAHAPGLFTQFLTGLAAHNGALSVPTAIAQVAQMIIGMIPAQVKTLGITPAQMETFVAGKLSAANPAVPASPQTAPLVAPVTKG